MERQQAQSDSVLAGELHSWSMSNIGEAVDAIEPMPVDVIDAVGFDVSDDDDVLAVERFPGADGDDHGPLPGIANEDASLGGQKRGPKAAKFGSSLPLTSTSTGRSMPSASFLDMDI
jgi:hypothetical protein